MKASRLLKAYLKEKRQDEDFELFDPVRLNDILTHFYLSASKQDGEYYKATSGPPFNKKIYNIKDADFRDANVSFKAALAVSSRLRPCLLN